MTPIKISSSIPNVSYTVLTHNRTVAKTVVVSEHCNVDIDAEGYPVGIETIWKSQQNYSFGTAHIVRVMENESRNQKAGTEFTVV